MEKQDEKKPGWDDKHAQAEEKKEFGSAEYMQMFCEGLGCEGAVLLWRKGKEYYAVSSGMNSEQLIFASEVIKSKVTIKFKGK